MKNLTRFVLLSIRSCADNQVVFFFFYFSFFFFFNKLTFLKTEMLSQEG